MSRRVTPVLFLCFEGSLQAPVACPYRVCPECGSCWGGVARRRKISPSHKSSIEVLGAAVRACQRLHAAITFLVC